MLAVPYAASSPAPAHTAGSGTGHTAGRTSASSSDQAASAAAATTTVPYHGSRSPPTANGTTVKHPA